MKDLLAYVNQLDIRKSKSTYPALKEASEDIKLKPDENQTFAADKSLVSFTAGISKENRQDVLDSMLLAQLAANHQYPDESKIIDWYNEFTNVLSAIGWTVEDKNNSTFKANKDVIEVEKAVITILTAAFGSALIPIILLTLKSIKELGANKTKFIAFEKSTHSEKRGAFQIAHAVETDSSVTVQMGTFLISSKKEIKQILFFTSSKDETSLDYYSQKVTLNKTTYGTIRNAIAKKLKAKAADCLVEIEL